MTNKTIPQNNAKNIARKFNILPLGEYKAEYFVPLLVPYTGNNLDTKYVKGYDDSEELAYVKCMLRSIDGKILTLKNSEGVTVPVVRSFAIPVDYLKADSELKYKECPINALFAVVQYSLSEEPTYYGQAPLSNLKGKYAEQDYYSAYEFKICDNESKKAKVITDGESIIKYNQDLLVSKRPQSVVVNYTQREISDKLGKDADLIAVFNQMKKAKK